MTPRVLVVEDEENVAYVVATALRLAGFETAETKNGRDALLWSRTARPSTS